MPTQQQVQAFADQQTALRTDASLPGEELQEHCNQLATTPPGVEELRINQGVVESRQWTVVADGTPRWAFERTKDGPSDGWAPKPGLDKLNFQPPLEPLLGSASTRFLAYAPAANQTLDETQKSAAIKELFGTPQGDFTWRGRKYSYTLASGLPCFPPLQ